MGPLTLEDMRQKLASLHSERKLEDLGHLWEAFGMRCAFLETSSTNALTATVVAEAGVGILKEVGGMLSLQLTPYREVTGAGVRERPDSAQLILAVGEKELHLPWPGSLRTMLEDSLVGWIIQQWRAAHEGVH